VLTALDTCGQADGRTKDMMQLTGTFRDYANALNKIYRQERGYDGVQYFKFVQDCNTCRYFVNIAANLLLPQKAQNKTPNE
jgi:hypothetical protein